MRLWSSWISGRNRFWKSILVNTTLVVLVIWGVGQWHARNLLPESDAEAVPDFELKSLVGTSHRLHASDGAVFLYFFAPWCTVCEFSISNLNDLPLSSTKNDARVYAVALDWNNVGEVEGFAKKQKLEVPVLLGNRGTAKDFRIQAFPTYYVLDGSKKVVRRNVGYSTSLGMRWNFAWVRAGGFGFQFLSFLFE